MTQKITTVLFDLDNTLIDTEKVKDLFRSLAVKHGYSDEEASDIYEKARAEDGKIKITLDVFVRTLKNCLKNDGKSFNQNIFEEVKKELKNSGLLLEGAEELIDFVEKEGLDYYLLSLGVKDWQEQKIVMSGLDKFFGEDNIIYTRGLDEGKAKEMRREFGREFSGEGTALFNDKPDESRILMEYFPALKVFLRCEESDRRFCPEDTSKLQEDFGDRVVCSDNLLDLKRNFENFIHPERFDGLRK